MQTNKTINALCAVAACVAGGHFPSGDLLAAESARQMNVRQGPETVFDRPVAEILPALERAVPTAENGRVGNELVFWGYELADGRRVFFFGCALVAGVDCNERLQAICPVSTTVLETREVGGNVVHRKCRPVALASPGEVRPGCDDTDVNGDLFVGLVTCGG